MSVDDSSDDGALERTAQNVDHCSFRIEEVVARPC